LVNLPRPLRRIQGWVNRLVGSPPPPERPHRLPADLLVKVRRIEIATNRLVDQGLAGDYHSAFKGRGVEFAEVRPYQPGDDVRTLDWNVTARMGEAFIKKYVEERDLTVFLVVDVSGSMRFGSRAILKRELAAEVAALLSFAALRNGDRVGAALISDRLELFLPPRRQRNHVLRLVREVLAHPVQGGSDLEAGLESVLRGLSRRSVVFLLSDFLMDGPLGRTVRGAARRHDLIAVEIVDPRDPLLPEVGPVLVRDAETGELAVVNGRRAARHHAEVEHRRRLELHRQFRRFRIDRVELRTDRPYLPPLMALFERRKKRRR
jgi:uncharacterized protein (DUF58 family)